MPNVDSTLDALYELRGEVGASNWKPEEVRRRRAMDSEPGEWDLVLVDPETEQVRPKTPSVRYRPTATDVTRVAEVRMSRVRRSWHRARS